MIFAVIEAKRKSGKVCEWRIEMKDDLFRLDVKGLEERCLNIINKSTLKTWDKFISCKFIKRDII